MPNPQLLRLIPVFRENDTLYNKKSSEISLLLAESEGFEPPVPLGTTVFKTAAIDHSANSPIQK